MKYSYAYTGWLRGREEGKSMYVLSRMRRRGREESEKDKQSPLGPCMRRAKSADNEGQRRHFSCHVFSWAIFILWALCSTTMDPREILFPVRRGRSNSHEYYYLREESLPWLVCIVFFFFFFFFFFILLPRSTNVQTLCITVHSDRMDSSIFLSFKTIVSRNRTSFFTHIWPSVFLCVVHNYWYRWYMKMARRNVTHDMNVFLVLENWLSLAT